MTPEKEDMECHAWQFLDSAPEDLDEDDNVRVLKKL